jgi:hypothetical protein
LGKGKEKSFDANSANFRELFGKVDGDKTEDGGWGAPGNSHRVMDCAGKSVSGDSAFARAREPRAFADRCPHESGVALRFPPQSMTVRAMTTNPASPVVSWTAPAKCQRSDLSEFRPHARGQRTFEDRRPHESGVALRFPPQSMTFRAMTTSLASSDASWTALAAVVQSGTDL